MIVSGYRSAHCSASSTARPPVALALHRRCARSSLALATAGVRRRFASHQLRHPHAVEMAREGVPLMVVQRQLGHVDLGITSVYLRGIDNSEIVDTVHSRRPPTISASVGLRL
jgi:site-specific recombinase XerD